MAQTATSTRLKNQQELAKRLAEFVYDPYGYVMWIFPWGEPGTPLAQYHGPRPWQKAFLLEWGVEMERRAFNGSDPADPIRMARASGHGIGKSALSAWIIKFILDTRPFSKGVVTANTSDQLRTKTWSEMAKWHSLSLTKDMWNYRNTRGNMSYARVEDDYSDIWRCDALTCREENSESFAGLHAVNATAFYLMDEGSAIPDKIYQVSQGGLTDGEPMQFVFGNPTRNTGFFRDIFGRMKHRWLTGHIDSRDVEGTNKELFQQWILDYGEDSDFVRVRVKGQFPRAAVCQLISNELVEAASGKHLRADEYSFAPKILGVDVAWFGDDRSTIWLRQGLAAQRLWSMREVDTIQLAGMVARFAAEHKVDAIFVDAGMGAGVIDQLRNLGFHPIPVYFGSKSARPDCLNKRAEMWVSMKEWLELGGALPKDQDIYDDLIGPEYHVTLAGKIQLEKKEDMKKRGLSSPDDGDGLALTFAEKVRKKNPMAAFGADKPAMCKMEYDVLTY